MRTSQERQDAQTGGRASSTRTTVRSHFGSSRDPSPWLKFPLHLPSRQPHQDSFRVRFLFAVYIALPLLLVAQSSSGKTGCIGSCPLSVMEDGYKAGKKPANCRTYGKTFPRPDVTLSDFLSARSDKGKRKRSQNASPAMSQRSIWVSWSDTPREQSDPSGEDTVMEDCTESLQSEINRKIKANDKLRKILTNMPEEYRVLIHGDSFKSKMQSLDDEKSVLLAAKRQFLPLQSRSRRNTRNVWKYCKNGSSLARNWKRPTPNRPMPNTRWGCWWPN